VSRSVNIFDPHSMEIRVTDPVTVGNRVKQIK
jgi:hypothetical protein